MDKYNLTYCINGIYGQVKFNKTVNATIQEVEEVSKNIRKTEYNTEYYYDLFNFRIEIFDQDWNYINCTEDIVGLPLGITEDIYFKMAMLQNNIHKKHGYNLDELIKKLDMLTDNKIRLLLGCK